MNKRALSPLIATVLLIAFAIALGAIVMSLGKNYIQSISTELQPAQPTEICKTAATGDPLKDLQIQYINDQISRSEYISRESSIIG
ncbi:MAG: hypothetical protein Q7J54_01695 [Candidatus Woesearchaeota archaeon]|nr:hypothetical protein [Candidatus Woesearchaeota archaeon]